MLGPSVDSLSVKRRLTCILAADAFGYSAHMGEDEEATVRVLSAHRAVIDGIIAFHEGRIVSTAGDSVLAEFSSVVEAVRCAVEIQDAIKTRNDSLAENHRMLFRVGINLGDVILKDNTLLGDGVNVAARLETIAEPGGICVSSSVFDQVTGKLDLGFQDIGEQALKNISRPIRVYRLSGATTPPRVPVPAIAPATTRQHRLSWPWRIGIAGGVGAAVLAGAIAWDAGWLRSGPKNAATPATAATTEPAPKAAPPATQGAPASAPAAAKPQPTTEAKSASTAAQQQRVPAGSETPTRQAGASGARTPASSEVAKLHAEAMRRQVETDLARARSEAIAGRGSSSMAGTEITPGRPGARTRPDELRIPYDAEGAAKWRRDPSRRPPTRDGG